MNSSEPSHEPERLLALSAALTGAETVEAAITHTIELVDALFDRPVASVYAYDPATETATALGSTVPSSARIDGVPDRIPESLVARAGTREDEPLDDDTPEATVDTDPHEPVEGEMFVPVGRDRALYVGVTEPDGLDEAGIATIQEVATALETALSRIDHRRSAVVGCDLARALFDQSNDATFVSDTDGTVVAVNRAAVELTGRDREALLTNGLPDIAGDTAAEAVREHLERTVSNASEPLTTTLEHAHDGTFRVELTSQRVDVDGTEHVRTIAHDLSAGARSRRGRSAGLIEDDVTALGRLSELTAGAERFDETVERLLSLGCDHFGLDTGILSRVDGDDYEIDTVVDATGTHEAGAVYDLGDTMCEVTLTGEVTEPLAFADVAETDHRSHPAAEGVRAYIAAPVVVNGETYGTVNFSMGRPRSEAFRPEEREFAGLVAQWIGTEIERRRRFEELERYETILEAVDDPVYALDADGRLTFLNEAAEREFGYDEEMFGRRPSVGVNDSDVDRMQEQIAELLATDDRSATVEFELETANGGHRVVENRFALIGDEEFRGTAGVLRDITVRKRRQRQLESFQQAIEEAADGVAILDDGEYTYVDRTHVDMYGFEDTDQLLGSSWRKLYDDDEVERLEREAFPALEADGYWRGMVTGSRPDGSTFPAEISLTITADGRLVCTVRDETERRERERELESLRRAVESARDGVAVLDDEEFTYVDQSHVELYGFDDKEQLLGNTWRELYDDEELERLEREAFPALESEGYWHGIVTGSRRDGSTFPAELSLTVIEDGRLVCTVRDATERMERSRWRREFLSHGPLMFIETSEVDGTAVVDSCNSRFLRRLGYDRTEVEGEPLASLYTADSAASLREGGYEDALTGEFSMNERTLVDADGNEIPTLLRAVPRRDETTGTNALFVDISERKAHERRQDATVEVLERVYEVTTDRDLSFSEKVGGLLAAGREYLDLPIAFLTRIETDSSQAGTQTIIDAQGFHDLLQPGDTCPLSKSYCRETIQHSDLTITTEAAADGWAGDPAHDTFGLETYIAGAVNAGGDTYGTLCFAAGEPRTTEFTETERSFVNLLRRWVSYELDRRTANEELNQERERLELTLSGTNTGLAEWDLETDVVTWDQTLVDIVGREVTSIEEFRTAVHPDDRERVQRKLETVIESGTAWTGEFRVLDGDGETLWLRTRATVIHNDDGEPVGVLAMGTDISERKEMERERRRNERRYRSLAENIPNGGVLTFDADLEYDLAAGELLSTFGIETADLSGMPVGTVLFDAADEELVPWFQAALDGERIDRRIKLDDRTLRLHIVPIGDDDGESVADRGLLLAQDVTEEARRERELVEERERFRLLTESVDEYAFFVVGEDGAIRTWNDGAENLFGYDTDAAVGMSMAELHPEADRESGLPDRLLQQARIAGESAHEGRRVHADGETFYADVRYAPLETDDGEFRGYAMIVRDMTDRRRERRRTERFVEESEDVVSIVDPDGTVTYASGSADRVLGYEPDDLVGTNIFDYLHPDGREDAMATFFAGMEDPDGSFQAECRFRSGDDEWLNVEGRCRNMLGDDAIDGMLLYLRDVTEIKKRTRRFESIFNQTFQFTGLLEPDGTVVEANEAALEFGGVERDAIVGEALSSAPWWDHSEAVRDSVVDAVKRAANGEFVRYETEVRGADGLATIDFSVKPVTDEDDAVSLLVVEGRDITTRKQHRRHLEVMQRVMRHNMRNDLTKLRGWTRMISEETDAEKRAEQFETVERILDKWESMTERMRDIRIALESQHEREAQEEAEALIEDAVAPIREAYADVTVPTDLSDPGLQVPASLHDAVHELVDNAAGASAATIEVELDRSADDWIDIVVRDDGPGMPDMEADVLETGEETPLNHGQGLGLWMVRMIVTQAGGEVSVESTENGTEVCLRVPASRTVESERIAEATG